MHGGFSSTTVSPLKGCSSAAVSFGVVSESSAAVSFGVVSESKGDEKTSACGFIGGEPSIIISPLVDDGFTRGEFEPGSNMAAVSRMERGE